MNLGTMIESYLVGNFQIETDKITVWVNNTKGFCVARFGKKGIDIHNTLKEQERTGVECIFCTHGNTTYEDYMLFQEKMKEFYNLETEWPDLDRFEANNHECIS